MPKGSYQAPICLHMDNASDNRICWPYRTRTTCHGQFGSSSSIWNSQYLCRCWRVAVCTGRYQEIHWFCSRMDRQSQKEDKWVWWSIELWVVLNLWQSVPCILISRVCHPLPRRLSWSQQRCFQSVCQFSVCRPISLTAHFSWLLHLFSSIVPTSHHPGRKHHLQLRNCRSLRLTLDIIPQICFPPPWCLGFPSLYSNFCAETAFLQSSLGNIDPQ